MGLRLLFVFAHVALTAHQFFLMRHCPRAPALRMKKGRFLRGFASLDNYSHLRFPEASAWGAAPNHCTPGGMEAISFYSEHLKHVLGETKITRILADDTNRTIVTAEALAKALAPKVGVEVDGAIFKPANAGLCAKLSKTERENALRTQLAKLPPPNMEVFNDLQMLIGRGKAPSLNKIRSKVSHGKYVGKAYVASQIVESFDLELASGLRMAWNKINEMELYEKYFELHAHYFRVAHGGGVIAQHSASGVLASLLRAFSGDAGEGTEVYVGHDTTLLAVMGLLGLETHCVPSLSHGAPPLSGLLFRIDAGMNIVHVDFLSPLHSKGTGFHRCPAVCAVGKENEFLPISEFFEHVREVIDYQCVNVSLRTLVY